MGGVIWKWLKIVITKRTGGIFNNKILRLVINLSNYISINR